MGAKVYIDLVFLANFLMDYILLRVSGKLLGFRKKRIRMVGASVLGAGCACLMIVAEIRGFWGLLLHVLAALLMLHIGIGLKKGIRLVRALLLLYGMAFLCGGAWEVLMKKTTMSLRLFLLFTVGTFLLLSTWESWRNMFHTRVQNLFSVEIRYRGKQVSACGFYDTGNLLMDPVTHTPASVLSFEILSQLLSEEMMERLKILKEKPGELKSTELLELRPKLLPFRSVGSTCGLIPAITLDELCIHAPGEDIHINAPVFALSSEPFTSASEYKVILNARLLDQEGKV